MHVSNANTMRKSFYITEQEFLLGYIQGASAIWECVSGNVWSPGCDYAIAPDVSTHTHTHIRKSLWLIARSVIPSRRSGKSGSGGAVREAIRWCLVVKRCFSPGMCWNRYHDTFHSSADVQKTSDNSRWKLPKSEHCVLFQLAYKMG